MMVFIRIVFSVYLLSLFFYVNIARAQDQDITIEWALKLLEENPDSGLVFLEELANKVKSGEQGEGFLDDIIQAADIALHRGKSNVADQLINLGFKYAKELPLPSDVQPIYNAELSFRRFLGYLSEGRITEAEAIAVSLRDAMEESPNESSYRLLYATWNWLADIYRQRGLIYEAIDALKVELEIAKANARQDLEILAQINIAEYEIIIGKTDSARFRCASQENESIQLIEKEFESNGESDYWIKLNNRLDYLYRMWAESYMVEGEWNHASKYLSKAELIASWDSRRKYLVDLMRARLLLATGKPDQALSLLDITDDPKKHKIETYLHRNETILRDRLIVECYRQFGLLKEAESNLHIIDSLLLTEDLRQEMESINFLQEELEVALLGTRITLDKFRNNRNEESRTEVIERCSTIENRMTLHSGTVADAATKIFLNRLARQVYPLHLEAVLAGEPGPDREAEVLRLVEAGKAVVLDQVMRQQTPGQGLDPTDPLARKGQQLTHTMDSLDHLVQVRGREVPPAVQRALAQAREDVRRWQEDVRRTKPELFRSQFLRQAPNVSELHDHLPDRSALISYSWLDTLMVATVLSHDGLCSHRWTVPADLDDRIDSLHTLLRQPPPTRPADPTGWVLCQALHDLYRDLIAPLGDLPQRLLIVPDGPLTYVPFDALLTAPADPDQAWNELPYLLHDHAVSVHFRSGAGSTWKRWPRGRVTWPISDWRPSFSMCRICRRCGPTFSPRSRTTGRRWRWPNPSGQGRC